MSYFKERDKKNLEYLKIVQKTLPDFCNQFFLGISQTTTPLTRLGYARDLKIFFDFLKKETSEFNSKDNFEIDDLNKIETFHIELYMDMLNATNGDKSKERKICALRTFFKYFFKRGLIEKNILPNVDLPKVHQKEIIRLEPNEVSDMLNEIENYKFKATRLRDSALVALLLGTGIRISECVGLNMEDIDFSSNSFKVTRKGGNEAILYFGNEVAEILKQYIEKSHPHAETMSKSTPLFLSTQKKRLCPRAVQNLVKKYAQIASPLKRISPHKLRSTYGTSLYRETGDIYIVADVLGHKDVNTTKKHYAAISEDQRKAIANKVKLRDK